MRSKTSLLNKTVFTFDFVHKTLPISVGLIILFVITTLLPAMAGNDRMAVETSAVTAMFLMTNPFLIALLSIIVALIQFVYMYRRRDSYMLHALPVSRRGHFFSHALSGFLSLFILAVICYLCVIIFLNSEMMTLSLLVISFCETIIEMLFFYGLALFVVMVCGNTVIAFITYGVLNALWLFINIFAAEVHYLLLSHPIALNYGSTDPFNFFIFEKTDFLFPAYFFTNRVNSTAFITEGGYLKTDYSALGECAFMLIPAVILIGLSYLLYEKKQIERTGEIVAFGWCRVVFRILFTGCGACLTAVMLYLPLMGGVFLDRRSASNITIVVVFLIIGGVISFFLGEMILKKTIHIFRGKRPPFLQGGIALGVVLVYVLLVSSGVFQPAIIPDAEDVNMLEITTDITGSKKYTITDPGQIEEASAKQRELIRDPELLRLAELRWKRDWTSDEAAEIDKSHNMEVRFMKWDDDYERDIQVLYYTFSDADKDKMLGSFMPYVNESSD